MRKDQPRQSAMEERLRQSVPPLRPTDHARAAQACARIASAPPSPRSPMRELRTFTQPLLRVAACLALLSGLALLMRPAPQAIAVPSLPAMTFNDLALLMNTPALKTTLSGEAADLAADLTDLTVVLNDHTLAILF